jgi:hypothetical protein
MKRLLLIFILTFNFQTWTKADDIRDFQIEGMSIGDSLLDFINEKNIKKKINDYPDKGFVYKSKKYYSLTFRKLNNLNLTTYDNMQFHLKDKDKKYIIQSISGISKMNIEECYTQIDIIDAELSMLFKESRKGNKKKRKHAYDKTGNSSTTDIYFWLIDGSSAAVICTDWTDNIIKKHNGFYDHLRLSLSSSLFNTWLNNEAYK